jgi:ASC-1-like (ASCH) protein
MSDTEVIEKIKEIDTNQELYDKINSEPLFKNKISLEPLIKNFYNILK